MNKKGFTLIELIAVIAILGLLLMVVIPATSRIMTYNDKREYDEYYKMIRYAAVKYARGRAGDLGGVNDTGCIENDFTIATFVYDGLLQEFTKEDEDVKCYTPIEYFHKLGGRTQDISDFRSNLGLDNTKGPSSFYNIRIKNDRGEIKVEHSMVCVRGGRVVYKNLKEKDGTPCKKFESENANNLYKALNASSKFTTADHGIKYINSNNNYVRYSGVLWRIVSIDTENKNVKIILDDIATYLNFNDTANSNYVNSNVDLWLNQYFKQTLRNSSNYLVNTKWNRATVDSATAYPSNTPGNEIQSNIGFITLYEFNKTKSRITPSTSLKWFLMSPKSGSEIWGVNESNVATAYAPNTFGGFRPAVILRSGISFIAGGSGTKGNPYVIMGDRNAQDGDLLNTRFSGEYIKFDNKLYKIISTSNEGTLITSSAYNYSAMFDNTNMFKFNILAVSGNLLNTQYYGIMSNIDKGRIIEHEFCTVKYDRNSKYNYSCPLADIRRGLFSLPTIGQLYAIPSTTAYWTASPSIERNSYPEVNIMNTNGPLSKPIATSYKLNPVIMLSPTVKVAGGRGKSDNPYTIK